MKHMKTIIFTLLLLVMSTTAQALVWEYGGPFWHDEQTGLTYNHETIPMRGSATAYSGNFGSIDGDVHFRAELRDADGDVVYVLEDKTVDVSTYTGFELVEITPVAYDEVAGDYFVHFTLSDSHDTRTDYLSLTVLPGPNDCPVFNNVPDQQVTAGERLAFIVGASDLDGDDLSYSVSGLPYGAGFNTWTGTFIWATDADDIGTHEVTFTVTDGRCDVGLTVTIEVVEEGNTCPVFDALDDQIVAEGESLAFTVSATDADNDALEFWEFDVLPEGADFDPSSGDFTWTPGFDQAGEYDIVFVVSDGECDVENNIYITVLDTNRCPDVDVEINQEVTEGELITFGLDASDLDGDELSYSVWILPDGAEFDLETGIFSWIPDIGQAGEYSVAFTVYDDECGSEVHVTITVNPAGGDNHAPVADFVWNPVLPSVGEEVFFISTSTDIDGDSLECYWDFDNDDLNDDSGECNTTWTFDAPGEYPVSLIVSDGELTDEAVHIISVGGQLDVESITCLSPVVEGSLASCSVYVDAEGLDLDGINVKLHYIGGEEITNCLTGMTGGCSMSFAAPEVGTHVVYATAELAGWEPDLDANPTAEFEVVAEGYEIRGFDIYNDPAFTQWDYDFFRGEDMYVSFMVVDMQGNPMGGMVTSVHLVSPPGGTAEFNEFNFQNPELGMYYYHLNIPTTHDFLGISEVFTFAFDFVDNTGAEHYAEVTIRNNPPVIDEAVTAEFSGEFDQATSFSLTPYESDVEDSGDGLTWSVLGVNTNIAFVTIEQDDTITVTPVSEGSDVITLVLRDLDSDVDMIDVMVMTGEGSSGNITCFTDADCGSSTETQDCVGLDLVSYLDSSVCVNPGTEDSFCDSQQSVVGTEVCDYICSPLEGCDYTQCTDGADNDGDGDVDMADVGCNDLFDDDESDDPFIPECSDGIDNDNDGQIDMQDPGCSDPNDNDESDDHQANQAPVADLRVSANTAAPDSVIDVGGTNSHDNDGTIESFTFVVVDQNDDVRYSDNGLGVPGTWQFIFQDVGIYTLTLTVVDDDGASGFDVEVISIGMTQCSDGIDNDGDGLTDLDDPECHDGNDDLEAAILVTVDNNPFSDQDELLVTRIDIDGYDVEDAVVRPGDFFSLRIGLENNLDMTLEDIRIEASIDEIQARDTELLRELDDRDSTTVGLMMEIPYGALPGLYDLRMVVSNDDIRRVKYRTVTIA